MCCITERDNICIVQRNKTLLTIIFIAFFHISLISNHTELRQTVCVSFSESLLLLSHDEQAFPRYQFSDMKMLTPLKSNRIALLPPILFLKNYRKCAHICPDDVLKEVRPSRNKEVGALQARIRELEVALSSASQSGSNYGGHRTRPASPTNASSSMHDDNASYQSYEPYNASGAADSSQHPGIQDVAEVMGTLLLGDDGSSRYLGKSAANALFHEDGSDEDEGSAGSDEDDVASSFSGRFQGGGFPMVSRGLDVEDFQAMLPPIAEAKRLVLAYYTNCAYVSFRNL